MTSLDPRVQQALKIIIVCFFRQSFAIYVDSRRPNTCPISKSRKWYVAWLIVDELNLKAFPDKLCIFRLLKMKIQDGYHGRVEHIREEILYPIYYIA
jgi:hypothetical protein